MTGSSRAPFELVLCDLGGVLVHVDSAGVVDQLARLSGRSTEDVIRSLDMDLLAAYEEGRVTSEAFHQQLAQALGLPLAFDEFARLWNDLFTENTETAAILQRLRDQCRVACLSNTNALHFQHLMATVPSMGLFHARWVSFELGVRKPDPQIYLTALERMGAAPWSTLYIDDREDLVAAGRQVGLRAIHFRDPVQLRGELQALGFEV